MKAVKMSVEMERKLKEAEEEIARQKALEAERAEKAKAEPVKEENSESKPAESRAQEYYEAFIATGGAPEDYHPIGIEVDYEVYYASDSVLSFAVIKTETLASAYETFHYYNYDLKTGEELTVEALAGEDWRERAKSGLRVLMQGSGEGESWWELGEAELEAAIDEAQLRQDGSGRPVLVFQKYSLGPGSMGRPELVLN